ncbi:MAG TPA: carboxypeptidase regulatory-like domain-containing protein, partial [Polyangiaceae bacterium]|nr:carboxypeptidase regulatory-like domain-containing protein [Polyangiaceae bacterium]
SRDVTLRLSAPASLSVHVIEGDGSAASGATVWLSGLDFWPPRQLLAAADGALEWQGLARGSYELRATLGSHVGTSSINLERGEHGHVTLRLAAGRDIAIRLVEADAALRAISGGDVVLVEDGLGPFPLRGQTDNDGRLTLGPVPFSPFTLSARAPGFMPESAVPVAADTRELQVALLRAGRVRGRVLDQQGMPVEGASLEIVGNDVHGHPIARRTLGDALDLGGSFAPPPLLIPLGELGVMPLPGALGNGAERGSWVSDRDGNFRLDEVPPGSIRVIARHPRFVESTSSELSLTPGGEVSAELVLSHGAAVLGRLVDVSGRPVGGAQIELRARHGTEQSSTFSREDGSFRFDNVASESDLLVARPSDRERFVLRKALELGSGETGRVELTLPAERAPLVVEVTGPERRPIVSARASLLSLDPDSPARQSGLTDASGRARFRDAAGRTLALRIAAPGYATFEAQLDGAPQRFEVNLERAVLVTGRVTQVRGRQPLAGARVVLTQRGERRSTSSDAQGQFQFAEAAPGSAELNVSHRGFATRDERLTIAATGRAERAFELPPVDLVEGGAVEGRVIDATGAPVRGARIGLGLVPAFVPAGAEPPELARSDAAGHFRLEGIAIGKTTVSAYAAGLGRGSVADVDVRAGEMGAPIEIRLSGGSAAMDGDSPASLAITLGERSGSAGNEVVIVDVAAGSEAERAGVSAGDVLIAVDGVDVSDMTDARRRLGGNTASDVIIDVQRGDELFSLNVRREAVRR